MKTKQLTAKHLQLLIALQEDPMGRLSDLAERVDVSRTTVASYLKWLSGENGAPSQRFFRVVPDFNEDALDMQTIDVFFETHDFKAIEQVEKICDDHPYTKYRARCYSGGSEVFAQFRIPKGTEKFLRAYIEKLKEKSVCKNYWILPTENAGSLFTVPLLEYWDIESFSWKFDWVEWSNSSYEAYPDRGLERSTSKLGLLSKSDIHILSILPKGARRKQNDMINELAETGVNFTSQEFSRRLKLLNENIITRYHVYVDLKAFDLYSNAIITAECDSDFSKELVNRISSNPIPFRSTLKIADRFLFWYLRMPSSHLSELLNYLHPRVQNLRLSLVDYTNTEVYILWPEAFDEEQNVWKKDESFIIP